MKVDGSTAIVTGAGSGIGAALAAALSAGGAAVVLADLDEATVAAVAAPLNVARPGSAVAVGADATRTAAIEAMIATAESAFGPVDLYFANAGVLGAPGLADEDAWEHVLDVNLRAHIRAARLLLPGWLHRGAGHFVATASAAGLLSQIGGAGYAVSKHAAVGFAEWLAITYGDAGVKVSCVCPMGVETPLLHAGEHSGDPLGVAATRAVTTAGAVLSPAEVARDVLAGVEDDRFLILPHPQVREMFAQKASDYDRWLRGMRRYQAGLLGGSHVDV